LSSGRTAGSGPEEEERPSSPDLPLGNARFAPCARELQELAEKEEIQANERRTRIQTGFRAQ
jgi:hypothetical protein